MDSDDQDTLDIILDLGNEDDTTEAAPSVDTLAHLVNLAPSQPLEDAIKLGSGHEDLLMPTPEPREKATASSSSAVMPKRKPHEKLPSSLCAAPAQVMPTVEPEGKVEARGKAFSSSCEDATQDSATFLASGDAEEPQEKTSSSSSASKRLEATECHGKRPELSSPQSKRGWLSPRNAAAASEPAHFEAEGSVWALYNKEVKGIDTPEVMQPRQVPVNFHKQSQKKCLEVESSAGKRKFSDIMKRTSQAHNRAKDSAAQQKLSGPGDVAKKHAADSDHDAALVTETFSFLISDALQRLASKRGEEVEILLKKHAGNEAQLYYQILAKHVSCGGLPQGMAPIHQQVDAYTQLLRSFFKRFAPLRVQNVPKEVRSWGALETSSLLITFLDRIWEVMGALRTGPESEAGVEPSPPPISWPVVAADAMQGKRRRLARKTSVEELTPLKKNSSAPSTVSVDKTSRKADTEKRITAPSTMSTTGLLPKSAEFLQKVCSEISGINVQAPRQSRFSSTAVEEDLLEWLAQFKT